MVEYKKGKNDIVAGDIKANIYDSVIIRVDFAGMLDIMQYISSIQPLLDDRDFIMSEELLKEEDALLGKDYNVISSNAGMMKNALGKEKVYRFRGNQNNATISISRFFICIELDYLVSHKLNENIDLLHNLTSKLLLIKFVRIERLSLRKVNSIICSTLNNLLNCFDKKLFNDAAININTLYKRKATIYIFCESTNSFEWDNIVFNVKKNIEQGFVNDKHKEAYKGLLDIDSYIYFDSNDKEIDIRQFLNQMNSKIFEIFKMHLTLSFLNDLIEGSSNKILSGVNLNER